MRPCSDGGPPRLVWDRGSHLGKREPLEPRTRLGGGQSACAPPHIARQKRLSQPFSLPKVCFFLLPRRPEGQKRIHGRSACCASLTCAAEAFSEPRRSVLRPLPRRSERPDAGPAHGANGSLVKGVFIAANKQTFSQTSTAPSRCRTRCDAGRLPERQDGHRRVARPQRPAKRQPRPLSKFGQALARGEKLPSVRQSREKHSKATTRPPPRRRSPPNH